MNLQNILFYWNLYVHYHFRTVSFETATFHVYSLSRLTLWMTSLAYNLIYLLWISTQSSTKYYPEQKRKHKNCFMLLCTGIMGIECSMVTVLCCVQHKLLSSPAISPMRRFQSSFSSAVLCLSAISERTVLFIALCISQVARWMVTKAPPAAHIQFLLSQLWGFILTP